MYSTDEIEQEVFEDDSRIIIPGLDEVIDMSTAETFRTGSLLTDLQCGGNGQDHSKGLVYGLITTISGKSSSGKTAKALESLTTAYYTCKGQVALCYYDVEKGVNTGYAEKQGIPSDKFNLTTPADNGVITWYEHFIGFLSACEKSNVKGIYVLDSWPSLIDSDKLEGGDASLDLNQGTFDLSHYKKMKQALASLLMRCWHAKVSLIIITHQGTNVGGGKFEKRTKELLPMAAIYYRSNALEVKEHKSLDIDSTSGESIGKKLLVENVKSRSTRQGITTNQYYYAGYGVNDYESCIWWLYNTSQKTSKTIGGGKYGGKEALVEIFAEDFELESVADLDKTFKKVKMIDHIIATLKDRELQDSCDPWLIDTIRQIHKHTERVWHFKESELMKSAGLKNKRLAHLYGMDDV